MGYLIKSITVLAPLVLLFGSITSPTAAGTPGDYPAGVKSSEAYAVQPGDTLVGIALRHNMSLVELALANKRVASNLVFPGEILVLPGAPKPVLSALPLPEGSKIHTVQAGETLFGIASSYGVSAGSIILINNISNPDLLETGQILEIPLQPLSTPDQLPPPFGSIDLSESVIFQGRTLVVKVTLTAPANLSGQFEGLPIFFQSGGNGQYWGIVAIHAMARPGSYPILLAATPPTGETSSTFTEVTITEGPYGSENIQLDSETSGLLDPTLIQQEREKLVNLWSQVTPQPRWRGSFRYPVASDNLRVTSYFGTRRTYNNSDELSFHGGTDFGGGVGAPIYAPAAGQVVLAEHLTVRGNAVLIDHGLGLYSGYWHQSQLVVNEGQEVQPGDLIGYIGGSGLVTGPHLHWELRLNGIAVNPMQWIQESIP